jgi:catechol 2,3-dioxygenase-like lactoylglutathione lyase family enzyme
MRLGPIQSASVICRDLDRSLAAYLHLGLVAIETSTLTSARAIAMGDLALAGAKSAVLGSSAGHAWLRLIEVAQAAPQSPFERRGWLALEIGVREVDALAVRLDRRQFDVLGEPANLDVSDAIRAMQVAGPDGEVLYLTEVKRPVPPFDLPLAAADVDQLFVAVQACADRERSLAFYEGLGVVGRWRFDTRLGSINRRHGHEPTARHPVAVAQLRGRHLIEFDALPWLPARSDGLHAGIRMISFARSGESGVVPSSDDDPSARIFAGPEGEWIELL